jgi:hypothetical protein
MDDSKTGFDLGKIADRNVDQVNFVASALKRRPHGIVGGRPDGTMSPAQDDALPRGIEGLLQQIENNDANLRAENKHLEAQLTTEREARAHLENVIRQIADLIVNGSKGG